MIDIEKAKQALDALQREKLAQQDRLQLAAETKRRLENNVNGNTTYNR